MNKELLQKYLTAMAAPQTLKSILLGDEEPGEDFNVEEAIQTHVKEREDFFIEKNKPAIIKAHEDETANDRYLDIVRPLSNRVVKLGGFTKEEADGKSIKELLDMLGERTEARIAEAGQSTDEVLRAQAEEFKNKYLEAKAKAEELETSFEAEVNTIRSKATEEKEAYIIDDQFTRLISSEDIKFAIPTSLAGDLIKMRLQGYGYKLGLSSEGKLAVTDLQGGVAITLDGNNKYENPLDMVRDIAAREKLLAVSNGGKGGNGGDPDPAPGKVMVDGKQIDLSGVKWLEDQM